MEPASIRIESSWKSLLASEFTKPYFGEIKHFLEKERASGKTFFPPGPLIFNAFNLVSVEDVKVVILGQDPYHGPGQAMGLSFSVPKGIAIPPSLRNIYKELARDIGFTIPTHGDLTSWSKEGVFLLNAILTVEANQAGSHQKTNWQTFTDAVIRLLSEKRTGIAFLLWGNFAKSKRNLIDAEKHLILEAAHPSPLAREGFSGCGHFSKTNEYLIKQGKSPINWTIT